MITIKVHKDYLNEIKWISGFIFQDVLGLKFDIQEHENQDFLIEVNGKCISIKNIFFQKHKEAWLKPYPFYNEAIHYINLSEHFTENFYRNDLPVLFGQPFIKIDDSNYHFNFDIFGTIFFYLSGYEEATSSERDNHQRFGFKNSILSKDSLIQRPVVDEYIDVLWTAISNLDTSLSIKKREPTTLITCDVDNPYSEYTKSFMLTLKKCAGDIYKRNNLKECFRTFVNYFFTKFRIYIFDNIDNFDWMMDEVEKQNKKITFFFIVSDSKDSIDGHYSIDEKRIRELLRKINTRKHNIGLHASYSSSEDPLKIDGEVKKLKSIFLEEGIDQEKIHNRQHYLKFSFRSTFTYLSNSLVDIDNSVGFAQSVGFRCGTSRPYSMYDFNSKTRLDLTQQPLIIMDNSILSQEYMGIEDNDNIISLIKKLKKPVDYFGGTLSILWHNDTIKTQHDKKNL